MSPRKIAPLIVIAAVAVASGWYAYERRKPHPLILGGTLEAHTVGVGSLAGGRVLRVHVDEGSRVAAGQLLATLETDAIDRQIAEQRAVLAGARAQQAKALAGPRSDEIQKAAAIAANDERERRRFQTLASQGIVARAMYDDAATRARASAEELEILRKGTRREDIAVVRSEVERQQGRIDTLLQQRSETEVHSSVAGTVQSMGLRPGDLVAPNQAVAEILDASQFWVRVYVPETLLGHVRVGQPVRVRVDTFPDRWFKGRISSVSSQGEYTPRNIQTRAQRAEQVFGVRVLVDPNPVLKAGMAAEIDLGVEARKP